MSNKLGAVSARARGSRAATSSPQQKPTSINALAKPCERREKSMANQKQTQLAQRHHL
ncbi:hypothetical protein KBI23_18810 [bacterium]|nr:hypothetical protein [bacterium]MBP9809720.1 hypothetical protein [bacterium]